MQMPVSLMNQKQRISSLLVSLRPTNAANTDGGLEPDFIIGTLKERGGRRQRRGERDRERGGTKGKK